MRVLALALLFILFPSLSWSSSEIARKYFKDIFQGLLAMTNPVSGFPVDSMQDTGKIITDSTSPSNIGMNLMVQVEALKFSEYQSIAKRNINKNIFVLKKLPRHSSGLFSF